MDPSKQPSPPQLHGVRAVVTGASSGLGAAMAEALLRAGARVALASRPGLRLEEAVGRFRCDGLAAEQLALDVRDAASVDAAAAVLLGRWGGLDMLVNNAGIGMRSVNPAFMSDPRPFFEVPPSGFAEVVATNLTGYFLVARAFAPALVEQGRGRIVNVSMNRETMVRRGFVPYGPSRAGAEALSAIMTEDLRPFGVSVNVLLPGGATRTGMLPENALARLPAGADLLEPEVMGPPIVFLASPEAEGLTAARIVARHFEAWLASWRAGALTEAPGRERSGGAADR